MSLQLSSTLLIKCPKHFVTHFICSFSVSILCSFPNNIVLFIIWNFIFCKQYYCQRCFSTGNGTNNVNLHLYNTSLKRVFIKHTLLLHTATMLIVFINNPIYQSIRICSIMTQIVFLKSPFVSHSAFLHNLT